MRQLTTILDNKQEVKTSGLHLVVMGGEQFFTHPVVPGATLTIGRGDNADVRLTDPLASRLHARLYVGAGDRLEIEDLGSINRTQVRDAQLAPGERVAIVPGEAITIGSTILMVQESRSVARRRRIWPHTYFEARLEEECARSAETRAPFVALRLHVGSDLAPMAIGDVVAPALRLQDMMAVYGPGEYEFLLPNTTPDLGTGIGDDLVARLSARQIDSCVGLSTYPVDGRCPELILAVACERVRGVQATSGGSTGGVVIEDLAMKRLHQLVARVAQGTISVLIVGETGVGKDVLARSVHDASPRAQAAFVCLNCASLAENLLESELFGHEKGAFTGAAIAKAGLLETAPGGTVFLDEVGEMPAALQAKLLRVLETRRIARVGSLKEREIDVRFVAATNRNLEDEVAMGRFRRDLYFRLNGITTHIPPLRERRSEIVPLAYLFLKRYSEQLGGQTPVIAPEVLTLLQDYSWPGNIRELRNVMERASLLCTGGRILLEHLPAETMVANKTGAAAPPAPVPPLVAGAVVMTASSASSLPTAASMPVAGGDDPERERVLNALRECAGNQTRAAKLLGMARSTLVTKLEAYQVPRPRKPAE